MEIILRKRVLDVTGRSEKCLLFAYYCERGYFDFFGACLDIRGSLVSVSMSTEDSVCVYETLICELIRAKVWIVSYVTECCLVCPWFTDIILCCVRTTPSGNAYRRNGK